MTGTNQGCVGGCLVLLLFFFFSFWLHANVITTLKETAKEGEPLCLWNECFFSCSCGRRKESWEEDDCNYISSRHQERHLKTNLSLRYIRVVDHYDRDDDHCRHHDNSFENVCAFHSSSSLCASSRNNTQGKNIINNRNKGHKESLFFDWFQEKKDTKTTKTNKSVIHCRFTSNTSSMLLPSVSSASSVSE